MTEELKPCPFCGGSAIDCGKDDICCTTPGCAMSNKYIPLKEWNTRAEPAPQPDDVEFSIVRLQKMAVPDACRYGTNPDDHIKTIRAHIAALTSERDLWQTENNLAQRGIALHLERIAALEAENKRLRDGLERIAQTHFCNYDGSKPFISEHDSGYSIGVSDGHRLASEWAKEALAQPEPQKCGTCGGRGWKSNNVDEYTRTGRSSIDCPDCNVTGKAGA